MNDHILKSTGDITYKIDYGARVICTDYQGIRHTVSFDAAFSRAIECAIHVEEGRLPNAQENLFLALYQYYLQHPPQGFSHPTL